MITRIFQDFVTLGSENYGDYDDIGLFTSVERALLVESLINALQCPKSLYSDAKFKAGIKLVVVKNSLLHKALLSMDVDYSPLFDSLKGTTSIMFSEVANAPAKLLKEYKTEIPALKAAYAEEGFYVGADQLEALATIKSKNEVIADIIALLQSPAKNVISALQSGGNTIHGVLKTLGERAE